MLRLASARAAAAVTSGDRRSAGTDDRNASTAPDLERFPGANAE